MRLSGSLLLQALLCGSTLQAGSRTLLPVDDHDVLYRPCATPACEKRASSHNCRAGRYSSS